MADLDFTGFSRQQLIASFLFVGLVLGGVAVYLGLNIGQVSKNEAAEKVVSTLEKQSGQDLELLNVESVNGLYKVDLKTQENQVTTYYITKDGARLTTVLADLDRINKVLDARKSFSECLSMNNVTLYGNISQQETRVQIQLLGGTRYAASIYKDVNNRQNLREAANSGVSRVPSLYYNGSVLTGIKQIPQIEEFTGCSYSLGG